MSGALEAEIRGQIAAGGPMPLRRFMALALGHPKYGYYITRDPLGAAGDFVTAPEISQMFGELIGLWAVAQWQAMGAPSPFRLVELGPGRGTLMADALRAARVMPDFAAAARLHLVETSPALRAAQARALGVATPQWHDRLEDVPDGPAIVVANEFFDAIPIDQFVFQGGRWHERRVGLDDAGALAFGLHPMPSPEAAPLAAPLGPPAEGAVLERMEPGPAQALARRIAGQGGAALVIDYGHGGGYGDTLQALKAHRFVDPLADPGEADLTAHVDFSALARLARAAGARAFGPLGQGAFLLRLGLAQRAERLKAGKDAAAQAAVEAAELRLAGTQEGQMGALFKAMVIAHEGLGAPVAFDAAEEVR
ncbi:class I SAM-dependent methyltransferase [Xanthobacter tagetidis]|uniref:Class I SAM-dependent methyltransferase n=1 Tax=Xanthobacter tagetidis TaxID=60216 RepID=A0A3L7AIP4_9HYPH|nr:SAM-dependent methyltransferase [Xanthobacter tagetidis]MBB6306829.1 NADH dehydrogenase [ubiquinone] 1 alpha subcomplex assembly factor 7 [Xanthobacter tagetidis]RLP80097.1 class I SAM-dependent methyltransferase [Xanthobacter tagetidis]